MDESSEAVRIASGVLRGCPRAGFFSISGGCVSSDSMYQRLLREKNPVTAWREAPSPSEEELRLLERFTRRGPRSLSEARTYARLKTVYPMAHSRFVADQEEGDALPADPA